MNIFIININSLKQLEDHINFKSLIIDYKMDVYNKYRKLEDKTRCSLGQFLIKKMINFETNLNPHNMLFNTNDYGKPFLMNDSNIHFNISHSGQYVVGVIDRNIVGIDVEKIENIDFETLSKNFYTKNEHDFLLKQKDPRDCFYRIWTLKESYIKTVGKGLSIPLNSFNIIPNENITLDSDLLKKKCYFKEYDLDSNYKLSVCSVHNDFCNHVINISSNDIYKFYNKYC